MPLANIVRTLSGDEVEARAIVSKTHKPSFIKAIQVVGTESTNASKLSELSLPFSIENQAGKHDLWKKTCVQSTSTQMKARSHRLAI